MEISVLLLLQSKLNTVASNPDDNIKPRTLFTRAQEVVKNGKKALSCVMAPDSPYKDYIRTGNLPSGMNHDDYLQFVREKMYFVLNPAKQLDHADDAALHVSTLDSTTAEHSENRYRDDAPQVTEAAKMFTFPGYIVFALMGPIVEDFDMLCHRSDLLMTSTPAFNSTAEKKLAGRHRARQQQEDKRKRHRLSDDTNEDGDGEDDDNDSCRLSTSRTTAS